MVIAKTIIYNAPENTKKYVVARKSGIDLWYWGSWADELKAKKVASEVNGIVLES